MFSTQKATSPKCMEEYVWLERIAVLLDLCSMQWFIEVVKSLGSNLYPRLGLLGFTRVDKRSTQRQQVLAAPALAATGARHIAPQWRWLRLQHINYRRVTTNAGGHSLLFWKETKLYINVAMRPCFSFKSYKRKDGFPLNLVRTSLVPTRTSISLCHLSVFADRNNL